MRACLSSDIVVWDSRLRDMQTKALVMLGKPSQLRHPRVMPLHRHIERLHRLCMRVCNALFCAQTSACACAGARMFMLILVFVCIHPHMPHVFVLPR